MSETRPVLALMAFAFGVVVVLSLVRWDADIRGLIVGMGVFVAAEIGYWFGKREGRA